MNAFAASSYQPARNMAAGNRADSAGGIRVELTFSDLLRMLMREIWLMAAIFSILSLIGIAFAMTMQREYQAQARLSVLLGDEYVYTPRAGVVAEGASPKQEQILQSEVEVLTSYPVALRAVQAIGLNRLFDPSDIIVAEGPDTPAQRLAFGVDAFRRKFTATATPNTTVIQLQYANKDPRVAADTLNKLIQQYLIYRREVLFEDNTGDFARQRTDFEAQLAEVDRQLNEFLAKNQVADFPAERTALQDLLRTTRGELLSTEGRLSEAEGRLSATSATLSREPAERRLEFQSDNSARRLELQTQLADLLTRYTDESQPVQDMRRRIAALDALLDTDQGRAAGTTRTGPNPIRDSIAADEARAQADLGATAQRQAAVAAQVAQLQARAVQLADQVPVYEDLMRRKTVLEEQVKQFANREAQARAQNILRTGNTDNIRVIEPAQPPTRGKSNKKWVVLLAMALASITALMAGLFRVFSRSRFPSSSSVGRSLGLPVLANVTIHR